MTIEDVGDLSFEVLGRMGDGAALVKEGEVDLCHPGLADLLGSTREEVEGRSLSELLQGSPGEVGVERGGSERKRMVIDGAEGPVEVEADLAGTELDDGAATLVLLREVSEEPSPWDRSKLEEVVEGSPDFISTSKPDEEEPVKYVNPAGRRLMGLPEEGPLPEEYRSIEPYHPDWALRKVRDEGRPVAEEEGTWVGETALLTVEGEEIPVRQTLVVHEEDGDGFFSTIIHDVSDLKEREREIKRQRDRAEQFFEVAGNVMVELDTDGRVKRINDRVCDVLGYERGELVGKDWFENLLTEEAREETEEVFRRLIEGEAEGIETHVNPVEGKEGDIRYVQWHNSVIRDGEGEVEAVLSSGVDITERKELEAELRRSRERYRRFVENIEQDYFFYRHDPDGVSTYLSPSIENILGYRPDEFERHYSTYMTDSEVNEGVDERTERTLEGERGPPYQVEIEAKDGSVRRLKVLEFPVEEGGGVVAVEGIAQDITRRIQYEEKLEEQKEQLEVLNRLIRHDIRNDMNVILAYSWDLEERLSGEAAEKVENISSTGEHVVELTETARNMLEAIASDEASELEPVRLDEVIESQVRELDRSHRDAVVGIRGELPEVEVKANEMLVSVFKNILNNAIQHNDASTPEVDVSVQTDENVVVEIFDNGPGIPDWQKEKVFKKEIKGLDSEGTGLGLYLVNALVDKYGGEVWVEDNEPEGAVFNVRLDRWEGEGRDIL